MWLVVLLWGLIGLNVGLSLLNWRSARHWARRLAAFDRLAAHTLDILHEENAYLMREFFADPYNPKWHVPSPAPRLH